jgi:mono/diheme cytochrome c family protein
MRFRFIRLMPAVIALVACSKNEPQPAKEAQPLGPAAPAPTVAAVSPASEARKLFAVRCSVCHGEDGTGNGPGAAALTPKPRNYTDAEWQKTVTDDEIKKTILLGGAAVGKSPAMPSSPDLQAKPEVLDELVKHVRSFVKK